MCLQDAFNLLPNIGPDLQQSFAAKSNDLQLVIYVGSLIRAVLALHNLISNKVCSFHPKNCILHAVCGEPCVLEASSLALFRFGCWRSSHSVQYSCICTAASFGILRNDLTAMQCGQ